MQAEFLKSVKEFLNKNTNPDVLDGFFQELTDSVDEACKQFSKLDLAKSRAAYLKWKVLENLDKYLIDFESAVVRRGGKVIWACDAENAIQEILQIIKKNDFKKIVKSKSSIAEEINLKTSLKSKGIIVGETDFGDYIIDSTKERPFHLVFSSPQKDIPEIAKVLNEKIGSSIDADPENLATDLREEIRESIYQADLVITGANFLIAENGMIGVSENEGNIRLATSICKTHIVLAGIEKIIPTIADIDLFFSLFASFGTGQKLTTYNSLIGPKSRESEDGPAEFIVLLIDNGRSSILNMPEQRQVLSCIKCGACQNVCPVFKISSGHSIRNNYSGPYGSVISPFIENAQDKGDLSYASTICGKCTDVCPVKIDIHNHLLRNRRDLRIEGSTGMGEKLGWYTWKKFVMNRKTMNRSTGVKSFTFKQMFKKNWGENREFPKFSDKSFNQLWREKFGGN